MIHLRSEIKKLLKKYCEKVYFQNATDKTIFPYVIYDFPNSHPNEQQEIFNFDVDIWDNQDDTTDLEIIADRIWKDLNSHHHIDEFIQFTIYRENRLPPLDEKEINIKRRKLIFSIKYFDRRLFE